VYGRRFAWVYFNYVHFFTLKVGAGSLPGVGRIEMKARQSNIIWAVINNGQA
jgi:hypothetical protein